RGRNHTPLHILSSRFSCRALVYHPGSSDREKSMGKLDGKITIVTGATSGTGRRTVEIFVQEGAKVVATGRREELGRSLEAALGKDKCIFLKTDATKEAEVKAMFEACLAKWGRLDCLFN